MLSPPFLASILKTDAFIDYVMVGAKGVKMPRGDVDSIRQYPVAYPDAQEQKNIADGLSTLDLQIAAETAKIDAMRIHKQGLMQQLFPSSEEA